MTFSIVTVKYLGIDSLYMSANQLSKFIVYIPSIHGFSRAYRSHGPVEH